MIAKRLFDIAGSALGLLLLWPLFLVIGLWIRLESPGPVFFRQERVGLHRQTFRIHKFRTMRVQNGGPRITVGEDPRITGPGLFLRRYKLDELPQLIDVLRGKMSLVGPRPEVPEYLAFYPAEIRDKVLSVRPGMTDWASLRFKEESKLLAQASDPQRAYIEEVLPIKQKLYLDYIASRTFSNDLKILIATLRELVSGS